MAFQKHDLENLMNKTVRNLVTLFYYIIQKQNYYEKVCTEIEKKKNYLYISLREQKISAFYTLKLPKNVHFILFFV